MNESTSESATGAGRKGLFQFKGWSIAQDRVLWKVGTDSVLLGAWMDVSGASRILDIGTGTGVLALFAARRNAGALIDACDVHEPSAEQAEANFTSSPWGGRLRVVGGDVMELVTSDVMYNHIIINPPYFPVATGDRRYPPNLARQGRKFSLDNAAQIAARLLTPDGKVSVVLPFRGAHRFIATANDSSLFVSRRLDVFHDAESSASLTLLELVRTIGPSLTEQLVLTCNGQYTSAYRELVGPFKEV